MKKNLYLLVLVCLFYAAAKAGTYHPFPISSGSWNYRYYDAMNTPTQGYTSYLLEGDTAILGVSYIKIRKNYSYAGALRESNKVIYFFPDTASREHVLYDFNLNAGDTIHQRFGPAPCTNGTVTVQYEDSVLMQNTYYRRLNLSNNVQWVEGIGSFYYLLEPCNFLCVSGNDYLQCKVGDSGSIDFATNSSMCLLGENTIEDKNNIAEIFPNPFNHQLDITLKEKSALTSIEITSIEGKLVYSSYQKIENYNVKINTSAWQNGIYFVRINNQFYKVLKN